MNCRQFKVTKNLCIFPNILSCIRQKTNYIESVYELKLLDILRITKELKNKLTRKKEAAKIAYFENLVQNWSNTSTSRKNINQLFIKKQNKSCFSSEYESKFENDHLSTTNLH